MEFFSDTGYSLQGRQLYEKPNFREPIWQTTRSGFEVEGLVEGLQEHVGFRESVSEGSLFAISISIARPIILPT
jgi:hypothetical protein